MAITMKIEGLAALGEQLTQLGEKAGSVASMGLYDGAGIMAQEINNGANSIRTGPGASRTDARYATPEEKAIVVAAGAGIAKFNKNGSEVQTSIGFRNSGYAQLNGKTVPVPKIVNSINSGTSFMHKQPFVRKAAVVGAKKAEAAITKTIEEKFNEIIKK